jgi:TolB-like protein
VLPLENLSRDPSQDYFVAGMQFKGTKKPLRDIGRELGVEGLVTGSVMRANDRVRVTTQLVRADSGAVVWANRYERNTGDVLSLQNELVSAIAREVRATLTPEQDARLASASSGPCN